MAKEKGGIDWGSSSWTESTPQEEEAFAKGVEFGMKNAEKLKRPPTFGEAFSGTIRSQIDEAKANAGADLADWITSGFREWAHPQPTAPQPETPPQTPRPGFWQRAVGLLGAAINLEERLRKNRQNHNSSQLSLTGQAPKDYVDAEFKDVTDH